MTKEDKKGGQPLPFLKWAGGKRWFVDKHASLLQIEFDRFIEPFLGSGAVFFSLRPEHSILSDNNTRLIETYQAIRDDWERVAHHLARHHRGHSEDYYYVVRSQRPRSSAGRAAQFIYLNRTCWNGLYRVNLNGQFNVPIGTKTNVVLDSDDFASVSSVLKNAEIFVADFEDTLDMAGPGDFVFIDPPYTVQHNHNGFIKYNEKLFSWDDQVRLRDSVVRALRRGANALVTNAHHDSVVQLYHGVGEILSASRSSVLSGKLSGRGRYEELIIKCY